jgi:hypothetical protein
LITAALAACAFTAVAAAQNIGASPSYGTYNLSSGFLPDPQSVSVTAGGSINAANAIPGQCAGMIANAPDVRLNWSGGQFTVLVTANVDTTLVINGADGRWYCNDDFDGLDPHVVLSGSGQYDIWVGTYGGGYADTILSVTEY